jgi:hypothetical protein
MNLEVWIPVILAVIALIKSILDRRAKRRAEADAKLKGEALSVTVAGIEDTDAQGAKVSIRMDTEELPELRALIDEYKKVATANREAREAEDAG